MILGLRTVGYPGVPVAAVQDPFGNRFGIIESATFDLAAVR